MLTRYKQATDRSIMDQHRGVNDVKRNNILLTASRLSLSRIKET